MKGASQIAPLGIRLPEDLKEGIKARATINGRSMNAEIVQMLDDAMHANDNAPEIAKLRQEITTLKLMLALQERSIEIMQSTGLLNESIENIEKNKKLRSDMSTFIGDDIKNLLNKLIAQEKKPT
ncbi:MAG: Arc family DNA-binding protein [Bifidobacterium longum]|nr:Arc family DNA-binding protein [Bifidobacterium longum]